MRASTYLLVGVFALFCASLPAQQIIQVGPDIPLQPLELKFSPDGQSLLLGTGGVYWLFDVATCALRGPGIQGPDFTTGANRPAGQQPIIGSIYAHATFADFTPDSKALIVMSDFSIQRWDTQTAAPKARPIKVNDNYNQVAGSTVNPFTGDGFVTSQANRPAGANRVVMDSVFGVQFNTLTGKSTGKPLRFDKKPRAGVDADWAVEQAAFSPNGKFLAVMHTNGVARLWDVAAAKELVPAGLTQPSLRGHIRWSPDSNRLLVTNKGQSQLWDPVAAQPVGNPLATVDRSSTSREAQWFCSSFSPDSASLAMTVNGNPGHDIQMVDAKTGALALRFKIGGPSSAFHDINHVAHAGKWLFVMSPTYIQDQSPWLWDPATGKPLASLAVPTDVGFLAAVSPDGKHIAGLARTTGENYVTRIWRLPGI